MEQIKSEALPAAEVLTDAEIVELLPELDGLISWAKGIQEYALEQALKGHKYQGYKVVEGRSSKKFDDPEAVKKIIIEAGIPEAMLYKPREMISVSDTEKILGKVQFRDLVESHVIKSVGKPALVPESDKRPEYGVSSAENDFKDEIGGTK